MSLWLALTARYPASLAPFYGYPTRFQFGDVVFHGGARLLRRLLPGRRHWGACTAREPSVGAKLGVRFDEAIDDISR
jgi:hypothetical protein